MSLSLPLLFFLSTTACMTLLVAAAHYYLRTRQSALRLRIEELQEQAAGGTPLLGGDFWDGLLRSTYGAIFGKSWFREKELELMRAGFRGPRVVKIYGVASLGMTVILLIVAIFALASQDAATRIFGIAAALVLGYFIPEQVLT